MKLPIGFFVASTLGISTLLLALYVGAIVSARLDLPPCPPSAPAPILNVHAQLLLSEDYLGEDYLGEPIENLDLYWGSVRTTPTRSFAASSLTSARKPLQRFSQTKSNTNVDANDGAIESGPKVPWVAIQPSVTALEFDSDDPVALTSDGDKELPSPSQFASAHQADLESDRQVASAQIQSRTASAPRPLRLAMSKPDLPIDLSGSPASDVQSTGARPEGAQSGRTQTYQTGAEVDRISTGDSRSSANETSGEPSAIPVGERLDVEDSPRISTGETKTTPLHNGDASDATVGRGVQNTNSDQQDTARNAVDHSQQIVGWPLPTILVEDLNRLANLPVTGMWAEATLKSFYELNQLELGDPASLPLLLHCGQLADQLRQYASDFAKTQPQNFERAAEFTRISYRIRRRIDIWSVVHKIAVQKLEHPSTADTDWMARTISAHKQQIAAEIPEEWQNYLMLDRADAIFSDDKPSAIKQQAISRKILARANSNSLSDVQREYAQRVLGDQLIENFLQTATGPLRLGSFLDDLERFEQDGSVVATLRFNNHFQNYYWSNDSDINRLAEAINSHYRNANFRVEVSDQMINRMLPQTMNYNQPVRDQIMGAKVVGQSRMQNRLKVRLIPDSENLRFRLQTLGSILSRTRAHHSGFVFDSLGNANVNASKGIAIGSEGISTLPTNVAASSDQKLLGVRSRFDGFPMLGWMARRIAQQQQASKEPQAKQLVEKKIKFEVQTRVDREIQKRIVKAQDWFDSQLMQPLNTLELEPKPLEMRTTENQVIVRYRVAAPDQMAANTARPHSLPGNLMSLQLHQSAINNLLNRIQVNGRKFTIEEFVEHLNELLGTEDLKVPENGSHDVSFEFASRDGLRLEFHDDRVTIILRLKKLRLGKRQSWRNLTVKADYFPQAEGQRLKMILDEQTGVLLKGHRLDFRDQVAVRTVFNSLFKPYFEFPLLPESATREFNLSDLAISQLVLTNGWIGISVHSNQQAQRPEQRDNRVFRPRTSRLLELLR